MLNSGLLDPELVRSRISVLPAAATRERVMTVVDVTRACLGRLRAIQPAIIERDAASKPPRAVWTVLEGEVAGMWATFEELAQAMGPLVAAHQGRARADPATGMAGTDEILFEEIHAAGSGEPRSVLERPPPTPEERIEETAWAISFVLTSEIEAFRRRLPSLVRAPDSWELVGAVQEHLGRLQGAMSALVTGIYASLPGGAGEAAIHGEDNFQLFVSLELRARVFQLRDDVVGIEATLRRAPPSAWQESLARLQKLLDDFVFGPAFAWLRAGDKRAFLQQKKAVTEVLSLWSPLRAEPARHAIGALARYLEALEVINQRECLVEHDRAALQRVVAHLQAAEGQDPEARRAIAKALAALAEAQGRDQQLDELLAQTLDPTVPAPLASIARRAQEILRMLGGE